MTGYHTPKHGIVAPLIDAGLVAQGYGSCSALARYVGVARTTVTRWRDGTACPLPEYWTDIEVFFMLPFGTIAKLVDE